MTVKTTLLAIGFVVLVISVTYAAFLAEQHGQLAPAKLPVAVACVGDSITEWSGYPTNLQTVLGKDYVVGNFGVAEAAISENWFKPYVKQSEFEKSKDFHPSVVVIMLGTNDAHTYQSGVNISSDYKKLVSEYQALESRPRIIVVKPPPIFENDLELSNSNLQEEVIPQIEQVADELDLPVVDVNNALSDHPEFFEDGVHPNGAGASAIAEEISEAIEIESFTIANENWIEFSIDN